MKTFKIGTEVIAEPLDGDFLNEFQGVVIGYKQGGYIQVKDQDDNVWDCDASQLTLISE